MPSAFCRNSRFPLSSTMQIVTCTFRFCASASAPDTSFLMAARSKYFLLGSSAAHAMTARLRSNIASLIMRFILSPPGLASGHGGGARGAHQRGRRDEIAHDDGGGLGVSRGIEQRG